MSDGVFADEVGALVFDVGHYSFRGGYAGEDSPKTEIPTMVGVINELVESNAMEMDGTPAMTKKYFIDTTSIHSPRKGMEMTTFLKDGMSMYSLMTHFAIHSHLNCYRFSRRLGSVREGYGLCVQKALEIGFTVTSGAVL